MFEGEMDRNPSCLGVLCYCPLQPILGSFYQWWNSESLTLDLRCIEYKTKPCYDLQDVPDNVNQQHEKGTASQSKETLYCMVCASMAALSNWDHPRKKMLCSCVSRSLAIVRVTGWSFQVLWIFWSSPHVFLAKWFQPPNKLHYIPCPYFVWMVLCIFRSWCCLPSGEYSLALRQCAAETDGFAWRQIFSTVKVATGAPGAVQLKVESVNVCLDAGQGNNVLAYVCCLGENLEADNSGSELGQEELKTSWIAFWGGLGKPRFGKELVVMMGYSRLDTR